MAPLRGTELARQLWEDNPTLRVIFMSGYNEEAPLPGLASEQITRFLAKPFDLQELAQLARALLDGGPAGQR